jgi:ferredoxin
MDTNDQIYRDLQKHLDVPVGTFPAAESGAEIRLLKHLLTPEEVKIAIQLSTLKPEPIKTIYKRIKKGGISISLDELQRTLDHMVYKGTVLAYTEGYKEKHYKNAGSGAGGMIDFQVNRLSKDFVEDLDKYHEELFAARGRERSTKTKRIPGLRTVPVAKSVPLPEKYLVKTYDDVRFLVENSPGPFSIANCICRQMKDMRGQNCKYSDLRETCLQIGPDHARQYLEMRIGRSITKAEAFDLLDKFEEAGFILMPENSQHPHNICCCCGDCCGVLGGALKSPRPADLYATNFYAVVDAELCKGCGTCIKRCQLAARVIVDGKATVNLDRCIGCGNCVVTCPANATRLSRKDEELVPPKDKDDTTMKTLATKIGRWNMFKLRLRMLLGLKV